MNAEEQKNYEYRKTKNRKIKKQFFGFYVFPFFRSRDARSGFTLVEALLVMGFAVIISTLIAASLIRPETQVDLDSEISKIIADLKNQQLNSMAGVTSSTDDPVSYGISFATTSYTLFRGAAFNQSDTSNFTAAFPSTIQFSGITLPSGIVIFSRLTGEVSGYVLGQDSVTLQNTVSNATGTLTINRFGAVTKTP